MNQLRRVLLCLPLALLLYMVPASAQYRLSVAPRLGYGNFEMGGMHALQREMVSGSDLSVKITDSFPAFYQQGITVGYRWGKRIKTGIVAEAGSTGGRFAYADYSGSLQVDQLLKYQAGGAQVELDFNDDKLVCFGGLEATIMRSTLLIGSDYRLYKNAREVRSQELISMGVGIKPYVGLHYTIWRLQPQISIGYLGYTGKPFHLPNQKGMVLQVNSSETGPDWTGIRINAALGLLLF